MQIKNIRVIIKLIFFINNISIIMSFEKNPLKNGNPQSERILVKRYKLLEIKVLFKFPMFRISCELKILIKVLEQRKIKDLNIAWVIKWKNAILNILQEIEINIMLSWLRVDKAIIFLISHSKVELRLAIIMVHILIKNIIIFIFLFFNEISNRSIKNTPAVTNVEEWTSAEIGVGADIASVNHDEKGVWALLENAAIIAKNKIISGIFLLYIKDIENSFIINIILKIIIASPIRFIIIVENLVIIDFLFW